MVFLKTVTNLKSKDNIPNMPEEERAVDTFSHYFLKMLANSSVGKGMDTGCTIRAPSTTDTGISLPTTPAVVGPNQPLNP